jgi:hypothetical protein
MTETPIQLGDIYGSDAPVRREFPFGDLTVSPLDLDFWLRLQREHGKTLDDFWRLHELAERESDSAVVLETTELLVCMLHAATWPYVDRGQRTFQGWKNALFVLMTTYPVLAEWFLQHVLESMPQGKGRARPKS